MTGPRGGVIGVKREQAIESLLTQMPVRFETSEEDPWLMGVLISCSATASGRLDRAGADATAGGGLSGVAVAPEQGDHHEREEPGDVEVEPVFDAELRRRSGSPAQAAARPTRSARRGISASASASATAQPSTTCCRPCAGRTGPRPRRASRGWPGRRSCARRSCAASRGEAPGSAPSAAGGEEAGDEHQRRASGRRRARQLRAAPSVASSGASASGANFVSPASAASAPRARPASVER